MNREEFEGRKSSIKGRVKQATGALIGNDDLESEGAHERSRGEAEERAGKARRRLGLAIEDFGKRVKK
jgi:uncharacterized protein YjbJ (UPF0337 family)